jgi:Fe-S oxidoreductase
MRIALFVTLLTDTLFPATGQAVVTLLERLGHQVELRLLREVRGLELAELPAAESCCGFGGTFSGRPGASRAGHADLSWHAALPGGSSRRARRLPAPT